MASHSQQKPEKITSNRVIENRRMPIQIERTKLHPMGGRTMEQAVNRHSSICTGCNKNIIAEDKDTPQIAGIVILIMCYAYSAFLFILASTVSYTFLSLKARLLHKWNTLLKQVTFTTLKSGHSIYETPRTKLYIGQR